MTNASSSNRKGMGSLIGKSIRGIHSAIARANQRRILLHLDEKLLQDIGLTRNDIELGNF